MLFISDHRDRSIADAQENQNMQADRTQAAQDRKYGTAYGWVVWPRHHKHEKLIWKKEKEFTNRTIFSRTLRSFRSRSSAPDMDHCVLPCLPCGCEGTGIRQGDTSDVIIMTGKELLLIRS
jgi:hypothetical protein